MIKLNHLKNGVGIWSVLIVILVGISQTHAYQYDQPFLEDEITLIKNSIIRVKSDSSNSYYNISGTSALAALVYALEKEGLNYGINDEWFDSFGLFVYKIEDFENEGYDGWQYWVNYPNEGIPMVSADHYELEQGDIIDWFYGGFGVDPESTEMDIKLHIAVQEDKTLPTIELIQPKEGGIYLFGSKMTMIPFPFAIIIGELTVKINAHDDISEIHRVDIFINDDLKEQLFHGPYTYRLKGVDRGFNSLRIVGYDNAGNSRSVNMDMLLFSN